MNKIKVSILVIAICLVVFVGLWAFQQTQDNQNLPTKEGSGDQVISTQVPGTQPVLDIDIPPFKLSPDMIRDRSGNLSAKQQNDLATFAGRFAGLYQTHGFEDYNTILGLIDYMETKTAQDTIRATVTALQSKTSQGYSQYAVLSADQPIEISFNTSTREYRVGLQTALYQVGSVSKKGYIKKTTADLVLVYTDMWKVRKITIYE